MQTPRIGDVWFYHRLTCPNNQSDVGHDLMGHVVPNNLIIGPHLTPNRVAEIEAQTSIAELLSSQLRLNGTLELPTNMLTQMHRSAEKRFNQAFRVAQAFQQPTPHAHFFKQSFPEVKIESEQFWTWVDEMRKRLERLNREGTLPTQAEINAMDRNDHQTLSKFYVRPFPHDHRGLIPNRLERATALFNAALQNMESRH